MTVYPCHLKTILDDTTGGRFCKQVDSFEPRGGVGVSVVGRFLDATRREMTPVFSGTKVGPDISEMKFVDRFFWVAVVTVMPKDPVV